MIFIVLGVIFGIICAAIASSKGRSVVGWFIGGLLIGWIALVIVACLSNLKTEKARQRRMEMESRRLREQLRQEKLKGEAFRQYSMGRLDAHDGALDMDTRSAQGLLGAGTTDPLLEQGPALGDAAAGPDEDGWYYELEGVAVGPVSASAIRALVHSAGIMPSTLLWREGFTDWRPVSQIEMFNRHLGNEWDLT